jgi:hypothetical protein
MKKLILGLCIALTVPTMSNAQGFLDKMKKFAGTSDSLGTWKNSDSYMIEGSGSITLTDGTKQDGTVQLNVTDMKKTLTYIMFTPASEMKPKKLTDDDIQYFTVKGKDFYPVRMKEDDITIGNKTIFMEMINASTTDKFKMYRLRKLEKVEMANATRPYDVKRGYYVMLPDFKNAHEIVDMTFSPFAKKMSEYLKDCPVLAKKIEDKEKGYKYNMFNGAANDEVFIRVMQEYNACGK